MAKAAATTTGRDAFGIRWRRMRRARAMRTERLRRGLNEVALAQREDFGADEAPREPRP